jgi:putative ABC transport system permease protein
MKTQLAFQNLTHSKVRTSIAVAGVAFAVTLVFVQLGFRGGVETTATLIYDALEFDILLRSPDYLHLCETRSFPRERLLQATATEGVRSAKPFYISIHQWQEPRDFSSRGIVVMGTDPQDPVFNVPEIRAKASKLSSEEFVLIDTKTRPEYGPIDGKKFGDADIGVATSLGYRRVEIIDHFELGTGLAANGAVLMNIQGYARIMQGYQPADEVSLGLITVDDPSQIEAVKQRLVEKFQSLATLETQGEPVGDVEVVTRKEALDAEVRRWIKQTPIGRIFEVGVYVALFIGGAIVYQILSTDIANLMKEYATLKAMGYTQRYLTWVVIQEAVLLAVFGYLAALMISLVCYSVTSVTSGLPITMTQSRLATVLGMSLLMCIISGWIAQRKLHNADPADLF